ncbi:hypothetical protein HGA91_05255 [candidate division WWE3 bacterium]|nr:hypothetical protein [candidate division WWE3 bacterium]
MNDVQPQSNKRTQIVVGLLLICLLAAGGMFFYLLQHSSQNNYLSEPDAVSDVSIKTSTLESQAGYSVQSYATRTYQGEELSISLVASPLTVPSDDSYYEGWLVSNTTPATYISLGRLEQKATGIYSVFYSHNDEYKDFSSIMVSQEKNPDNSPETPIAFGSFD